MLPPTDSIAAVGKLLGVVKVEIGAKVFRLPVQMVPFSRDREGVVAAGGFFDDGHGGLGILVSSDASPDEVDAQIRHAAEEAVTHLTREYQN